MKESALEGLSEMLLDGRPLDGLPLDGVVPLTELQVELVFTGHLGSWG